MKFDSTSNLLKQKLIHFKMIADERLEYKKKRDRAILDPSSVWSLIIDGADQTAFGLPHFSSHTKSERGHSLKVKLVGMLEHAIENKLRLLTMTEEHQTGANHIVESLHRFLMDRSLYGDVPPSLYLQVDNCSRENKNRFFLAYIESLVVWKVFKEIEVSFLPVGHTHEDIDQAFSTTSKRLATNDAITLQDLHNQLRQVYNRHTSVSHMRHVINWSGLCQQEGVLTTKKNFSQFRYFRFIATEFDGENNNNQIGQTTTGPPSTIKSSPVILMAKVNVHDEWEEHSLLFLRSPPDLRKTPCTTISDTSKDSKHSYANSKHEVTKRIESVEVRIKQPQKLEELKQLRDSVFRPRKERFHWNLEQCIELRGKHSQLNIDKVGNSSDQVAVNNDAILSQLGENLERVDEGDSREIRGNILNDESSFGYSYDIGSFIAVLADSAIDGHNTFWVGRITKLDQDKHHVVISMTVHWYEPYARSGTAVDKYSDKYAPSYIDRGTSKQRPWTNTVETSAILINFSSLLQTRRLPSAVQKHLRTCV